MISFLVALHCEAKGLIDHYGLKRQRAKPFPLYVSAPDAEHKIELVVTGIGSEAMAMAVGWLAGYNEITSRVWLNVGTAGHAEIELGEAVLVHGVAAVGSERCHYPPLLAKWKGGNEALLSYTSPCTEYPGGAMVDMEANAFFSAALRFSTSERVQSIKVISDNETHGIEALSASRIEEFMLPNIERIARFSADLEKKCGVGDSVAIDEKLVALKAVRMTHSQERQMNEVLTKLTVLGVDISKLVEGLEPLESVKQRLGFLRAQLNSTSPKLTVQLSA